MAGKHINVCLAAEAVLLDWEKCKRTIISGSNADDHEPAAGKDRFAAG
jgi:hypothetical protein